MLFVPFVVVLFLLLSSSPLPHPSSRQSLELHRVLLLLQVDAADYGLDKPIVIGEYASVCAKSGSTLPELYTYAYEHGYSVSTIPHCLFKKVFVRGWD